jgi:Spy/CpxP family protein refolding chaperone
MKRFFCIVMLLLLSQVSLADTQTITQVEFNSKVEQRLKVILSQLDLSSEQKSAIHKLVLQAEPQIIQYTIRYNENNYVLNNLAEANYDKKKVDQLADQQGDIESQVIQLRMKMRHEIYEILTPMQRLKVKKVELEQEKQPQNK